MEQRRTVDISLDTPSEARIAKLITVGAEHVNHDSGLPPYRQLADILRTQIERGEITKRLPSERTLAQTFGVTSGTVRKSLALLRERGYIRTHQGWGHEVTWQPPEDGT